MSKTIVRGIMVTLAAAVAALAMTGNARAADCGCSQVGGYKKPAVSARVGNDTSSPKGIYSATHNAERKTVTVKHVSTGATVLTAYLPYGGNWGFSPDDHRFVYDQYMGYYRDSHSVTLYDLQAKKRLWETTMRTTSGAVYFSPRGRYLLYAAVIGRSDTYLSVVDARTGVEAHQGSFIFTAPPVEATPEQKALGMANFGFSPDAEDRTFVYGWVTGTNTAQLEAVNLVRKQTVVDTTFSGSGFWQFSPCGDVLGLVNQPDQGLVNVMLFSTAKGLQPIANDSLPSGKVSLTNTLDAHIALVDGEPWTLAPNTADDACPTVASVGLDPAEVTGGNRVTGTVTLTAPAPFPGLQVSLSSGQPAAAKPTVNQLTIPEGATRATFSVDTYPVATDTTVSISATHGTVTKSKPLKVLRPGLQSVSISRTEVPGGLVATGTVTLTGKAPSGGVEVALSSSDPSVATVPATVRVDGGSSSAAFEIRTRRVTEATSVVVKATLNGTSVESPSLIVLPPPPPQRFAYSLGTSVSDGVPAVGAGNIEVPGAVDIYVFSATAGQRVYLDMKMCRWGLTWHLSGPGDTIVFLSRPVCSDDVGPLRLPATGEYRLTVDTPPDDVTTGTYSFRITNVPDPQTFDYTVGTTVSNGVPAPGAGNIEAPAAVDSYRFTSAAAQSVSVQPMAYGSCYLFTWWLDGPNGRVFGPRDMCTGLGEFTLADGLHTLTVTAGTEWTYSFRILDLPVQTFSYTVGTTVSNGVPSAGAGNIEVPGAADVYTFSAGGPYSFWDSWSATNCNLRWHLTGPNNTTVFANRGVCELDRGEFALPTGSYTLRVEGAPGSGATGTYSFLLRRVIVPPGEPVE